MFERALPKPTETTLLLGPRGTGKSTWIKHHFPKAPRYDLLNNREALRLSKDPSLLFQELSALPAGSWAVIDEIQKVPELMDEAQRAIEDLKLKLVLSGSSARKLKRGGINLLAGRARRRTMYPLTFKELSGHAQPEQQILGGSLPLAITSETPKDYLYSYAEIYLKEEIQAEALARNIGNFSRFLEVAARQNGQLTNATSIGRDAQVSRQTVQSYFEVLSDTLMGYWVEAWQLKKRTKQVAHPKFYFFDPGVVRALSGRLPYPPSPEEMGPLLETYLFNEIRAYLEYTGKRYPMYFWQSYDGVEVDFICETLKGFVGIEIKASQRWERRFSRGLARLADDLGNDNLTSYGIFRGERSLVAHNKITVLTVTDFLERLWSDEILP